MTPEALTIRLIVAAAIALTAFGAVAAWVSGNAIKRLAGLVAAMAGAMVAAAALGAPDALLGGAVAILFATVAAGVALAVRLQEAYGAIEAPELDQADRQDEASERAP